MPVCRKPITGATLLRAVNTPLCVIGGAAWAILYRDLKNKLDLCSGILLPLGH